MKEYLIVSLIGGIWYILAPGDESIHNSQMHFDDKWCMEDFFKNRGWKYSGPGPMILEIYSEIAVYVFYRYREEKDK